MYTRTKALCGDGDGDDDDDDDGGGSGSLRTSMLPDSAVQQLLLQMAQLAKRVQQQCKARELANIVWACGYLQQPAVVTLLLPSLLQEQVLQQAEPQHLANTLLGVVRSGATLDVQQLQQLLSTFIKQLPTAVPQAISNTLWAVATMGQQIPPGQLQQLLLAFIKQLHAAKLQDFSNTLWAVATMGEHVPPGQLQHLLSAFIKKLPAAKPQDVSNTLWAVATMGGQVAADTLDSLLGRFTAMLRNATPQATSNVLLAVAKLKQQVPPDKVAVTVAAFTQKLPQASSQTVANILWALATMQQHVPVQQLEVMTEAFTELLPSAMLQGIANKLWACGELRYSPKQLLSALKRHQGQLEQQIQTATLIDLASIALGCAQLGYSSQLLPGALLQAAVEHCKQGTVLAAADTQALANLCWAAAILDAQEHTAAVLQLAAACSSVWQEMMGETLRQLYQVHLWLLDTAAVPEGLSEALTAQQLQQCRQSWEQSLTQDVTVAKASRFHEQVFAALQQLPASTWQQAPGWSSAQQTVHLALTLLLSQLLVLSWPLRWMGPGISCSLTTP